MVNLNQNKTRLIRSLFVLITHFLELYLKVFCMNLIKKLSGKIGR